MGSVVYWIMFTVFIRQVDECECVQGLNILEKNQLKCISITVQNLLCDLSKADEAALVTDDRNAHADVRIDSADRNRHIDIRIDPADGNCHTDVMIDAAYGNRHPDVMIDLAVTTHSPPTTVTAEDSPASVDCDDLPEVSGRTDGVGRGSWLFGRTTPASPKEHYFSHVTKGSMNPDTDRSSEVEFRVGQDRQLMIGSTRELAAISPVFSAMFTRLTKKRTVVEIPDVQTQSFGVILRCAAQDSDLQLTEGTVWNVLQAAHQFQVLPVVTRCFHFLLHKHKQRHKSHHLCMVLEKAHQLNYLEQHAKCLLRVKRHASKIFKSASGLSELCHQCMVELVTAEDLPVSEVLVHDAVVTWARGMWTKGAAGAEPSWEDLRAVAGELVYHVRYLAMPRHALRSLFAREAPCLLNEKEKVCLLLGNASRFPPQVATRRRAKGFSKDRVCDLISGWKKERNSKAFVCLVSLFLFVVLLVCLIVYLCVPEVFAPSSSEDSPVYVLVIEEEQY